ncbi:hypothetical protein F511_40186 [Dorcoceras hygrometricum]|uniref:Uncharacterized protein n=1 Tax=Dorcoceras hygrometricum TaxID=472368 RepID=A0A2Z7BIG7_9LAMI|nr:hypothetical protein F511_40186 [Dorcoceras hygrometricum]
MKTLNSVYVVSHTVAADVHLWSLGVHTSAACVGWNSDFSRPLIVVIVLGIKHVAYTHLHLRSAFAAIASLLLFCLLARMRGRAVIPHSHFPYAPSV